MASARASSRTLDGSTVAITGAASGIGRALALNLAARSAKLALSDVDHEGLAETAALIRRLPPATDVGADYLSTSYLTTDYLDVSDRASMFAWAAKVASNHDSINMVINNAGVALSSTVESTESTDFEWLMGINFWGVVHGTQALSLIHI